MINDSYLSYHKFFSLRSLTEKNATLETHSITCHAFIPFECLRETVWVTINPFIETFLMCNNRNVHILSHDHQNTFTIEVSKHWIDFCVATQQMTKHYFINCSNKQFSLLNQCYFKNERFLIVKYFNATNIKDLSKNSLNGIYV